MGQALELNVAHRMTETEALGWLIDRGIEISLRTFREMRARKEIGYYRLPRGRSVIRFSESHLVEAFMGEEVARGRPDRTQRSPQRPKSSRKRSNPSKVDDALRALAANRK